MQAEAFAKVNLSLQVRSRDASGFHPLRSLVQSITWHDRLELNPADDDAFTVTGPGPDGEDNLAWRAVAAVRSDAGSRRAVALHLDKSIPIAAGLGGGSADAAAGLELAARLFDAEPGAAARLAPDLGSDVPFCLQGGFALMEGRGEIVTPLAAPGGYALAVVVPPFELPTPLVFEWWDRLEGPEGPAVEGRHLPPSLRGYGPLRNDLYAAAVAAVAELADWRSRLSADWERPILLSGSGPALFAFFVDHDEAEGAVASAGGIRAGKAVVPAHSGWRIGDGTLR